MPSDRMDRQSLINAIKSAREVYVWVKMTTEDGVYVRASKANTTAAVREFPFFDDGGFLAKVEGDCVYIN